MSSRSGKVVQPASKEENSPLETSSDLMVNRLYTYTLTHTHIDTQTHYTHTHTHTNTHTHTHTHTQILNPNTQMCVCTVAIRSQHLGPGSPGERWWMAYTADIHQSVQESVHCVILIDAMENTCGGGRGRPGNVLKLCHVSWEGKLEARGDQETSRTRFGRVDHWI